jgi:hypothetical protein
MLVFNLRFLIYPYNSYENHLTKKVIQKSRVKKNKIEKIRLKLFLLSNSDNQFFFSYF